jgi:hypothetical protein
MLFTVTVTVFKWESILSLLTGLTEDTITIRVSESQNGKVWVAFGDLLEPFITCSTWPQWIHVLCQICNGGGIGVKPKAKKKSISEN